MSESTGAHLKADLAATKRRPIALAQEPSGDDVAVAAAQIGSG